MNANAILKVRDLKKFLEDIDDDLLIYFKDDENDWIKEAKEVKLSKLEWHDSEPPMDILVITGFEQD